MQVIWSQCTWFCGGVGHC